jgi:UPF0176 protein
MASAMTHLSFYRFRRMGPLLELRDWLKPFCRQHRLTGTILLAPEGVNAMVSGEPAAIAAIRAWATDELGVSEEGFRESRVAGHSFSRMLVKIKKEIIVVGDSELDPENRTGRRLSPEQLKAWLDEGRPVTLVDTRNAYEVGIGTFEGAQTLGLDHSREFAKRAAEHLDEWRSAPVVTFCTGGIRCEKGSALLLKLGLEEVYQLDGGILRYFEKVGPAHFRGNCFVFDGREAVDGQLRPVPRAVSGEQFGRHCR